LANKWLNDPETWRDYYKKKPVEYLRIIATGQEPFWDTESGKYVAKSDDVDVPAPSNKTEYPDPESELNNNDSDNQSYEEVSADESGTESSSSETIKSSGKVSLDDLPF
jgi:hypothetical protein